MHRLLTFFACLAILLSFGMSSVVHAAEPVGCLESSNTSVGHVDGDDDQVPADADKGYPHHHGGCHGHHIAAPADNAAPTDFDQATALLSPNQGPSLLAAAADPALRPPQA